MTTRAASCSLKTEIRIPLRDLTIALLVPCELKAGHLGRCAAPLLQSAAPQPKPAEAQS